MVGKPLINIHDALDHRNVLILGYGQSGKAALKGIRAYFHPRRLAIADENFNPDDTDLFPSQGIQFFNGDAPPPLSEFDTLVISPGFSPRHPWLRQLTPEHYVLTEIDIGYSIAPGNRWVAVTGTNGKTTTTSWLFQILNRAGLNARACGNIGYPLTRCALESAKGTIFVVEVSSFQLFWSSIFRPDIGILLNVDRDHLDWHRNQKEYIESKMQLFYRQTADDTAIVNLDEAHLHSYYATIPSQTFYFGVNHHAWPGIGFDDPWLYLCWEREYLITHRKYLNYSWPFLISNLMATLLSAVILKIDLPMLRAILPKLTISKHRLEWIKQINGVDFFNDSKATNTHAVKAALENLPHPRIVLIAGGLTKGQDFAPLSELVSRKARAVVLIGESAREIASAWAESNIPIHFADSMNDAVFTAFALAKKGDAVLLSPGCASFDMFRDYADRGEHFRQAVSRLERKLKNKQKKEVLQGAVS